MSLSATLYLFLFLKIVVLNQIINADAQLLLNNCPQNQIKFEKLIGIRPNQNERGLLLHRNNENNNNAPSTLECIKKCLNDPQCMSFILNYNTSECYSFRNQSLHTQNFDYDSKPDNNIVWFRKTCLRVPDQCQSKAWVIEILAGATLLGANTKKIKEKIARSQCINSCLQERSFLCKSIKFNLLSKYMDVTDADPIGICTLSGTDRHLSPTAFRVSKYEDEYIENQCVGISNSSEYCAYEEYENSSLEHVDVTINNLTQSQCQHQCDTLDRFNCRGFSTVPLNNNNYSNYGNRLLQKFNCYLHSEDSKFIGPKLLVPQPTGTYYERARCLNVSVSCSNSYMRIMYQPEEPFYGRIYTSGYSNVAPCYAEGFSSLRYLSMNLPLNGTTCGISEAASMEPWNRTLKSVLLVIQYNALIQTQSDRLIKVGCVYGNDDSLPVTLDTSVNITSSYPNRGSTVMNSSSVYPNVTMRIVDFNTKETTNDTEIGQDLQLVIEIKPGNGPYDIWAGNLIATSGNNTLQLLDESGCPTYLNLFPQFINVHTNYSRMLVSHFQAFKFFSNPVVRFSVMVHFCVLECPPIECIDTNNRLKRNTREYELTSDVINASVYNINSRKNLDNESGGELMEEMPLDTVLFVRGVNISPDQLVYGENNRILVAGYDYVTNEVCVDYNLFIGLLVTWVLLQIVIVLCCFLLIRKYKKYFHIAYTRQLDDMHQNFGFGMGRNEFERRVHWADQ